MRQRHGTSEGLVIAAEAVSLQKAVRALWVARSGNSRQAEASSVSYQGAIGGLVFAILLSGAVELVLVDFLLSVLWVRLLALALGLPVLVGLLSFVVALRAYPHCVGKGALKIRYGACFELSVPLEFVALVAERKVLVSQKRIADVRDGVLSVPVMGVTNLAVTLDPPIRVALRKTGVVEVQAIQLFAEDPRAAADKLRNGGRHGIDDEATAGPRQRPLWARALRWVGPVVLLLEIVLVMTGLLDWRIAAGILAVTEGTLAVLGVAAGAALVGQYRRGRAAGLARTKSLSEAFFFLMPTSMATMVRRELSFLRVLTLAIARRTEGERPSDVPLAYGGVSRKILLGVALVLLAAGLTLLLGLASSAPWIILGFIFAYAAVLTAALGLASKVRPHVLRSDSLLVRWGLHQELVVLLTSVRSVEVEQPLQRSRRENIGSDPFAVPGSGRERLVLRLHEPIAAPLRLGRQAPAETILLSVDNAVTAQAAIAARLTIEAEESAL